MNYFTLHPVPPLHVIPFRDTTVPSLQQHTDLQFSHCCLPLSAQEGGAVVVAAAQNPLNSFIVSKIYNYGGLTVLLFCLVVQPVDGLHVKGYPTSQVVRPVGWAIDSLENNKNVVLLLRHHRICPSIYSGAIRSSSLKCTTRGDSRPDRRHVTIYAEHQKLIILNIPAPLLRLLRFTYRLSSYLRSIFFSFPILHLHTSC